MINPSEASAKEDDWLVNDPPAGGEFTQPSTNHSGGPIDTPV